MKLYDFAPSPNCRKVRAVAYELGIELEHVPVDLLAGETRLPQFVAKNPNGRVPLLEDGDLLLWESNAITGYLALTGKWSTPDDEAVLEREGQMDVEPVAMLDEEPVAG